MYCEHCGTKLKDTDRFCYGCGKPVAGDNNMPMDDNMPMSPFDNMPQPAPKKMGGKLLIGVGAGVLAAGAITLVATGVFDSDSTKVLKALNKSGNAYAAAVEKMDLPDLSKLAEKKASSEALSFWVDDAPSMLVGDIEGLGFRVTSDVSIPARKMDMTFTPYYGSLDLLNAKMNVDNDTVYLSIPEWTDGASYMFSTKTLGANLSDWDSTLYDIEDLSFNCFDFMDQISSIEYLSEDAEKQFKKTMKEQLKTIVVKKTGTEKVEVNDVMLDCKVYAVTIPKDTSKAIIQAAEDAYDSADAKSVWLEAFRSLGLPDYVLDEVRMALNEMDDNTDGIFSEMKHAMRDIDLTLYLNDGYVVAVECDENIDGSRLEIVLNMGGGKSYVDDFSMEILVDGEGFQYRSNGNHAGKNGVFTDTTKLDFVDSRGKTRIVDWELTYEPKAKDNNFSWQLDAQDVSVDLEGNLVSKKNGMTLKMDKIRVAEPGGFSCTFGMEYTIGEYEAKSFDKKGSIDLFAMSKSDLESEALSIADNVMSWCTSMEDEIPGLGDFFY